MKTIRSISPLSVFRISCIVSAVLFACVGCLGGVLPFALLGTMTTTITLPPELGVNPQDVSTIVSGGLVGVLIAYGVGILVFAFVQALIAAVAALIYNLLAPIVAGVQVDLD